MRYLTWLRSEDRSDPAERRREHGSSRRRAAVRPRLEMLEERRVLSTLTVTSSLDNGGAAGDGTLRGEIAAAQPGDTIDFASGLQTIWLSGYQLEINTNLTIQGPGAGQLAISGNNNSRVFEVDAGANVSISGLTIGDGTGQKYATSGFSTPDPYDGYGGGILNLGTLSLSGCTVSYTTTTTLPYSEGGGIDNRGTMTVSSSTVTGNTAWAGGGISNAGSMTLSSDILSGDSAVEGGGISNASGATATVSGTTLSGESASYHGGGIYNGGTMTLSGSTVTGNTATSGGGIFNAKPGNLTILSSVVLNNTSSVVPSDGADICSLGSMKISKDSQVGQVSHK
jgi:hypothetical protein